MILGSDLSLPLFLKPGGFTDFELPGLGGFFWVARSSGSAPRERRRADTWATCAKSAVVPLGLVPSPVLIRSPFPAQGHLPSWLFRAGHEFFRYFRKKFWPLGLRGC